MKKFIRVMKALSDPSRVKIVKMLAVKEMCVCEITAVLGLAQPTVSKHLKALEEAGLVDFRKDGAWVNYFLAGDDASPYGPDMLARLEGWLNDDPQIQDVLLRASTVDRGRIEAA